MRQITMITHNKELERGRYERGRKREEWVGFDKSDEEIFDDDNNILLLHDAQTPQVVERVFKNNVERFFWCEIKVTGGIAHDGPYLIQNESEYHYFT